MILAYAFKWCYSHPAALPRSGIASGQTIPACMNANYLWIQLFHSALNTKGRARERFLAKLREHKKGTWHKLAERLGVV